MSRRSFLAASMLTLGTACGRKGAGASAPPTAGSSGSTPPNPAATASAPTRDPRVIASRATVPVLCWHQLRDWESSDTSYNRALLICPPANFRAQLDALRAAGYTTISPDQHLAHLTTGAPLPPKPILLTFDDAQGSQFTVALPELRRRGMTGTFFIMTVVLGKRNWMSRDDLRTLDRAGMTIAAHTYDHHEVDKYSGGDWQEQLNAPRRELESILGKPVRHFAYPYGAWNRAGFPHVQQAGFATAYQLTDKPMDPQQPLYTLRRQLVDSTWTGPQMLSALQRFR